MGLFQTNKFRMAVWMPEPKLTDIAMGAIYTEEDKEKTDYDVHGEGYDRDGKIVLFNYEDEGQRYILFLKKGEYIRESSAGGLCVYVTGSNNAFIKPSAYAKVTERWANLSREDALDITKNNAELAEKQRKADNEKVDKRKSVVVGASNRSSVAIGATMVPPPPVVNVPSAAAAIDQPPAPPAVASSAAASIASPPPQGQKPSSAAEEEVDADIRIVSKIINADSGKIVMFKGYGEKPYIVPDHLIEGLKVGSTFIVDGEEIVAKYTPERTVTDYSISDLSLTVNSGDLLKRAIIGRDGVFHKKFVSAGTLSDNHVECDDEDFNVMMDGVQFKIPSDVPVKDIRSIIADAARAAFSHDTDKILLGAVNKSINKEGRTYLKVEISEEDKNRFIDLVNSNLENNRAWSAFDQAVSYVEGAGYIVPPYMRNKLFEALDPIMLKADPAYDLGKVGPKLVKSVAVGTAVKEKAKHLLTFGYGTQYFTLSKEGLDEIKQEIGACNAGRTLVAAAEKLFDAGYRPERKLKRHDYGSNVMAAFASMKGYNAVTVLTMSDTDPWVGGVDQELRLIDALTHKKAEIKEWTNNNKKKIVSVLIKDNAHDAPVFKEFREAFNDYRRVTAKKVVGTHVAELEANLTLGTAGIGK